MSTIPDTIPVCIIGGGPVGLTCSILLSLHGVNNVVFERHPSPAIFPKAAGLNQRSTEIFAKCGLLEKVYNASSPASRQSQTAWFTSLGPEGRQIASRWAWAGGPLAEPYEKASPCRYVICPQLRLEPILRDSARELNPDSVFYNHEVTDVIESPTGVTLSILDRGSTKVHTVAAAYALACDGGRSMATALGLHWEGVSDIVDMVAAHIRAPLTPIHPEPRAFISWFINPELGGSIKTGFLFHVGPYDPEIEGGTRPETEEWNFACAILPHENKHFTEADMLKRMETVLKVPDIKIEILSVSHWFVNAKVASPYHSSQRRVFVVGDAAHRMPPWAGLGMNTGVQDAENICWKLAWALNHPELDPGRLLESYDEERRPVAERNIRTSLSALQTHGDVLDRAIGINPGNTTKENVDAMNLFFDENSEAGKEKRDGVKQAMEVLDLEFYAHGMEIGWFYPSLDLNHEGDKTRHDGQLTADGEFVQRLYHPSTIPGHHLPHAWLVDEGGKKKSTRDLVQRKQMVLIAEDPLWQAFKHELVEVILIGGKGRLKPADCTWETVRGVPSNGAVLVRPDGIVAWRWHDDAFVLEPELEQRIEALLGRILRTL